MRAQMTLREILGCDSWAEPYIGIKDEEELQ